MIQIAVVAPTTTIRAGLRAILGLDDQLKIVVEALNFSELDNLPDQLDLLILTGEAVQDDLGSLPLDEQSPPAILLITHDTALAQELTTLGLPAWGLLPLDFTEDELLSAAYALSQGLIVAPQELIQPLFDSSPSPQTQVDELVEPLTEREMEVFELLAEGFANKQIAYELEISEHTVKFHVSSIYTKLNANNRTEAVMIGARLGLVVL